MKSTDTAQYRNSAEIAELVRDGVIDIEEALHWHLTENHFPPIPGRGVEVALQALIALEEGDSERSIVLPYELIAHINGWSVVSAAEVEEYWHLERFRGLGEHRLTARS